MGRVEIKKKNKEETLYQKGFQLFVDKGFVKTTISDIAKASGLAKGTFYLYFKDKYELRDKLIVRHSKKVLQESWDYLQKHPVQGFENQLLVIIDYIIKYLQRNIMILKFINKNLSWGIFENAMTEAAPEDTQEVFETLLDLMEQSDVRCGNPELMLFTIFELVSSTCYSCILYSRPVSMQEYLPYLHQSIHQILEVFISQKGHANG